MGLLCKHDIHDSMFDPSEISRVIPEHVDDQWYLDGAEQQIAVLIPMLLVQEPLGFTADDLLIRMTLRRVKARLNVRLQKPEQKPRQGRCVSARARPRAEVEAEAVVGAHR